MTYVLGSRSRKNLEGVHPRLVKVVHHAIKITDQDFTILNTGGVRTVAQQRELVRKGSSKTMNSLHLPQADGFGHAVDLVPWIEGSPRWEWEPIYHVAVAMHKAAKEEGLILRWGAVWDRDFNELMDSTPTADEAEDEVQAYVARRRAQGKRAFIDGPHYEIQ